MEFPDLGKHCSEQTCKQLDFLPITCDACKQDFCKDHFSYAAHKCPFAFKKNVQVPICPLCSIPVPVKRGENPDVVVGEHMDRDCTSHPGRKKEKEGWNPRMCRCPPAGDTSQSLVQTPPYTGRFMQVFTHRCSKEGCRKKEMLQLACVQCRGNFCIQHRHPLDHSCQPGSSSASRAGTSATRAPEPKPLGALNALSSSWLAKQLRSYSKMHVEGEAMVRFWSASTLPHTPARFCTVFILLAGLQCCPASLLPTE
ncbi:AN1-type zinc finger protein 2A isoform X2 [Nannospalax galili]|nr:AN1-type zinc finger protein 2A isoform X2 [Nannospalax galili]